MTPEILDFTIPAPKPEPKAPEPKKNPTPEERAAERKAELLAKLDAREVNFTEPPAEPETVFSLKGVQLATPGNLVLVAGAVKTGKSAALGALLAAAMGAEWERDTLGFQAAANDAGKALVWFDCEQAPFDAWQLVHRACRRAGLDAPPAWVKIYALADMPTAERRAGLAALLEREAAAAGGVYAVVLDGTGDLCISPNDEAEAFGLVEELHRLAIEYACPVVSVLHENPGSEKTRGHLGSQLERKAEACLRLKKNDNGETCMFSVKCRRGHLPEKEGVWFAWDDIEKMHVTVQRAAPATATEKKNEAEKAALAKAFGTAKELGYSALVSRLEAGGMPRGTAKKKPARWLEMCWLDMVNDKYRLGSGFGSGFGSDFEQGEGDGE